MTPKGAAMVIDSLSLRVFEIQELRAKLGKEELQHKARIKELERVRDGLPPAVLESPIISVG
jgi:hypothetical protein